MEFANAGAHCSLRECRELDFLPFTCDGCKRVYCLNHRTYNGHRCECSRPRDLQVVLCPICKASFQVYASEMDDVDRLVNEHIRIGRCEEVRRAKREKKARTSCHVRGCKKSEFQPVRCKECRRLCCLSHRFPSDHKCGGPSARPVPGAAEHKSRPAAPAAPAAPPASSAAPRTSGPRTAGWGCAACTFSNSAAALRCEMCRNPRPERAQPGRVPARGQSGCVTS